MAIVTYKEIMANLKAETQRIRDARLEFEAAMQVYNPDINRSSILPYPHIDGDRTIGLSVWHEECQESARLNPPTPMRIL